MAGREPDAGTVRPSRRFALPNGLTRLISPGVRVDSPGVEIRAERIPELDGLRGLACLVILIYHLKARLIPVGWAAVDLFFVLSGFLISTILLGSRGTPGALGDFYRRRAQRIWPVYYLAVLGIAASGPWLPEPSKASGLIYYLTFLQNVPLLWSSKVSDFSPYLAHFWSLAIEAQFYLIWPAFVLLGGRIGTVVAAIGLTAMSFWARSRGFDTWLLVSRCDGLALGGLLAVVMGMAGRGAHRKRDLRIVFGSIGLAALAYLGWLASWGGLPRGGRSLPGTPDSILAVAMLGFASVGLVLAGSGGPATGWLRGRGLRWVGKVSFGLYVYHYIVYFLTNDVLDGLGFRGRPVWQDAIKLGLSFLLAGLSWRFVEKPIMAIGRGPMLREGESKPSRAPAARAMAEQSTP